MSPKASSSKRMAEAEQNADAPLADFGNAAQFIKLAGGGVGLITGCRIPKSYFITKGFGETDAGGGVDPWETGSYDLALEDAGIQDFNIMPYTSVMPPESHEIARNEAQSHYSHGAVLEVIMSVIHGVEGDRLSAGVANAQVRKKSNGCIIGGYAAEYKGHAPETKVKETLQADLQHIFDRRYKSDEYELLPPTFTIIVQDVEKGFGTALASICFTSYISPIVPIAGQKDDKSHLEEDGMHAGKVKKQRTSS